MLEASTERWQCLPCPPQVLGRATEVTGTRAWTGGKGGWTSGTGVGTGGTGAGASSTTWSVLPGCQASASSTPFIMSAKIDWQFSEPVNRVLHKYLWCIMTHAVELGIENVWKIQRRYDGVRSSKDHSKICSASYRFLDTSRHSDVRRVKENVPWIEEAVHAGLAFCIFWMPETLMYV